jgi:RNA polymerase sigma-32 factor
MNTSTWPAAPEGLTRYLQTIRAYPMLSAEEERTLSCAWRDRQDVAAAHKLVTSHLRLVARVAMEYRGYGLPLGELISEGNIGMMRALRRFDPERGFRLSTYAIWWIKSAIQEYILHSWSLVKMGTTAAQKKLFFNLRRLKGQIRALEDGDLRADQVGKVARILGVPEHDVISMNRRMAAPDSSLNVPMHQDDDDQWQDWLVDGTTDQEAAFAEHEELAERKTLLGQTFDVLNKREQHILVERWLKEDPMTLNELAAQYSISRERVRQIEIQALAKLRKAMNVRMASRAAAAGVATARPSAAAAQASRVAM